ncbi:MAG: metallophosphoesterase [Microvirga sp.]|nr:metallophosphoesterase [Microvirga sp.]
MKLWVLSDLHLPFGDIDLCPRDADVLVCAGDVGKSCADSVRWLAERVPDMPVVFVAGNHEFYRGYYAEGLAEGREQAARHQHVHFLHEDGAVIGGVRFLGATLWTDYRAEGHQAMAMMHARDKMNDYRAIKGFRKKPWQRFTPEVAHALHQQSVGFLACAMAEPFDGPTVVLTHHAPHRGSVAPQYQGDLLNAAYYSDLGGLIESTRPEVWVHGHMHAQSDYEVGATRIVANPRGYPNENPRFDPELVVELPEPGSIPRL